MALIDVEIDGLTESVVHVQSGRRHATRIVRWGELTSRQQNVVQDWRFDWGGEIVSDDRDVFALLLRRGAALQGLMSMHDDSGFVFVHLIESAPKNIGRSKTYLGVPGNLMAFACLRSMHLGFDGYVSFDAKSELIAHYERTLGARRTGSSTRMIIVEQAARELIRQYFKEDDQWPT